MFHKGKYDREKQLRFSIRKVSFGAASVAVAALFMFLGNGAVSATEQGVPSTNGETQALQPKDQNAQNGTYEGNTVTTNPAAIVETNTQPSTVEKSPSPESAPQKVETLDKQELTDLIKEVDGKFAKGTYSTKTEESTNNLRSVLEEARTVLSNAKTQAELSQAHANLIVATTKLQTKAEEKKEAPAVDTTNGKSTVGTKATNTEKTSESNSIANSGSRDERNGKVLDTNNPFRTDAATTDTDPTANQTYTAPAADANLETLSNELKTLPNFIENNKKIQNMDTLGNALKVEKGSVTEINEFGGWKAVGDSGKFAIARKTESGVFPIETVNTVWDSKGKTYNTWVLEQSFDRTSDYMLFLSKVRTQENREEETFDGSKYQRSGEPKKIAKGVKGFNGIQKTFKAYSKEHGSKVIVSFKTGYTGDIDGTKAKYKVEVIINRNGQEEKLYDQTFTPEVSKTNSEMNVVKASDGTNRPQNFSTPETPTPTKEELEAKIANNKPNGTGGTFTSKEITLPEGVTEYTVRISSADNQHLGMGYQSPYRHYALPVTGLDFNIDQDTGAIAKDLLSRIYDKLKATETADTDGKTNETKAAYLAELENINTLITSTNVKKTVDYKKALESILSKHLALEVDKTGLTDSKTLLDGLVNEDPTPGKTQDTATAYNAAKQEAIKAIDAAKKVIDNTDATVAQVREALATVNAKKTALQKAKDDLIEAATAEEKAKLKADADSLVKADTTGKTPKSIEAYNIKYEAIKAQLEAAKTEADKVLAKGNNATKEEVKAAQAKVDAVKTELETAKNLLVEAATTEEKTKLKTDSDALKKADTTGKTADSIKAYGAEFEKLKAQLEETKAEADKVLAKGNNATKEEVKAAQEKVDAAKTALDKAAESLKDLDRDAAKKEIADAAKKATDAIEASTSLTLEQKAEEKAKVAKEAKDATDAIDNATTEEGINSAKENGKLAIEKEAAISAIKATKEAKLSEIDKNTSLSDGEKAASKAEVAKVAMEAVEAIQKAETQEAVNAAQAKGEVAIKAVNPVGKEKALDAIQKVAEEKIAEIDKNDKLSSEEKVAAKAEVAKAATEAVEAIKKADTQATVEAAQAKGEIAIKAVNPVGKEKALDAIQKAAEEKIAEIDKNDKLSAEEKAAAKAEVGKVAIEAVEAIQKAETQEAVNTAQSKGETAIKAVNPVGKEKALDAIQKAAEEKIAEIDKNAKLSAEEKAASKAEVAKAAIEAVEAIQKATTQEAVNAAQEKGETAIKAVNPVGKEKALEAIKATKEAKLSEIDKNTSLSDDEKAASKAEVAKVAIEAVEAIQKAATQEAVNEVQAKGETAIKAVNPIGKEKALDAIQKAAEEKIAEIDKNAKLSSEEKAAAKAEVAKAAIETVEAIQKAETQEAVNTAQAKGEATIKAVNPVGKAQAKAAIDKALAEKEKAIDARTDLTDAEKEVAKKSARAEAESAKKAIDNATDSEAVEKALRTFLYQIDQESLVYNRPTFNLEAYIQASITGVVKVERGKAITQADIISKLSLPENVTVISIDLPDTNTLGDKFAKVMLRLPDGTEVTVKVPVRVVASQNGDSKPEIALPDYGRSNGSTNTEATVDKAKLEGAIRQLDELIIQESAKFDSETSKEATVLSADAKKVFANADVSQAEVDAMVKRIEDFMAKVASSTDHTTPANDQAAQTPAVAPSTAQAAANAGQTASAQANARKAAKELPNTGTADSTVAMVAAAASALLGLGLAGRRRKEDEEA